MLSTVCSSCATTFRVTPEQLEARAGRVRCGNCNTVFDAMESLTKHAEAVTEPATIPFSPAIEGGTAGDLSTTARYIPAAEEIHWPPIDMPGSVPDLADSAPASLQLSSSSVDASPDTLAPLPDIQAIEDDVRSAGAAEPLADIPAVAEDLRSPDAKTVQATPIPAESTVTPSQMLAAGAALAPAASTPGTAEPQFDFGPAPQAKRSRWWLPLSFILVLLLLAQTSFYFRGAIALLFPELKPYISELCVELGCEVPLPRRAELLGIETSDLQADPANPGIMVLSATLRNRAAFPQAFPALELTLTNDRDQPLARRVLEVNQYLTDQPEAFAGSSERQIRVHVEAGTLKASGYRLYLFFP